MKWTLPKNKTQWMIVGSGRLMAEFVDMLLAHGYPAPLLVAQPADSFARDRALLKNNPLYLDIHEYAKDKKLELFVTTSLKDPQLLALCQKKAVNAVFSINCRMIFTQDFLKIFKGWVLNIHHGALPTERSGSPSSCRILNEINKATVTIFQVDAGIDSGPIIDAAEEKIDSGKISIHEMNDIHMDLSRKLLRRFLKDFTAGKNFSPAVQNENEAIIWPRLYTEVHGAINWDWHVDDILKFIRAFGPPFPGAFTFYEKARVEILEAKTLKSPITFHPFFWGRIIGQHSGKGIRIACQGGVLLIKKLKIDGEEVSPAQALKCGHALYTPTDDVLKARRAYVLPSEMKPPVKK